MSDNESMFEETRRAMAFASQSGTASQRNDKGIAAMGRPPLFAGISPADYQRILATARIKEYARGEMLFIEGDPVTQIVMLTSGFVKITQLGTSGSQVILRFGVPGDVLGASSLLTNSAHFRTVHAFRACQTLVWDARLFKVLVNSFPILHQNMVKVLGEDLLELEERFREVATERVALRVARQLVRLLDKIGRQADGEIEISLSREELAQMTGTTLFTVSRLLSAWEARGMVKPRREAVMVCDINSLREISE